MTTFIDTNTSRVDYLHYAMEEPHRGQWQSQWGEDAPTIEDVLSTDQFGKPGVHIYMFHDEARIETLWEKANNRANQLEQAGQSRERLDPVCHRLSRKFGIPELFWTSTGWDANGYYWSQTGTISDVKRSYTISLRFLLKQVRLAFQAGPLRSLTGTTPLPNGGEKIDYTWEYYGLHSTWAEAEGGKADDQNVLVLLCFDMEDHMRMAVREAFEACHDGRIALSPFGAYSISLLPIVRQYDGALWGFRKPIRNYERGRVRPVGIGQHDLGKLAERYTNMHELERHIIHAAETLRVAMTTLGEIIGDHKSFKQSPLVNNELTVALSTEADTNIERTLRFYRNFLTALELRAKAFEDRLQNEIRLAFNTVAANDSSISTEQLSISARQLESLLSQNSSLTTVVSLLTLIFLPGSFISGFFGMNFFSMSSDAAAPRWSYVHELWIFFAVTTPITLSGLAIWYYYTKYDRKQGGDPGLRKTSSPDSIFF